MAELDPIINDEQALSYTEGLLNWTRGLKYLEAVVRYVRNSRKQIPALQNEIADLTLKCDAAKAAYMEAEREGGIRKQAIKADSERLLFEQSERADRVRKLTQEVATLEITKGALANDVEQSRLLLSDTQKSIGKLTKEEADLNSRVVALKQEMDRIEKALPLLLKR